MGHGRVFALYVALYCLGRLWIENLRIDTANEIFGLRLNVWTSLIVGLGAVIFLVISARRHPGREDPAELDPDAEADADSSGVEGDVAAEATGGHDSDSPDPSAESTPKSD